MTSTKVPHFAPVSKTEHRNYEAAVATLRQELALGRTYDEACATLAGLDHCMQAFIREEFLKTLIAEEHFGAGVEISDIALFLALPYETVESALLTLLNDMVREAALHQGGDLPSN
jgi:hypothetical protein